MPQRPPGLNIQPIPLYIIPYPTLTLLTSISKIRPTWRSELLSSVPPNLQDWFIPLNNKGHWEVYKSPLFPENNGRWRFEYKTAFAHVLGRFDDDFIHHFKSITGIGSKSGVDGMIDLMELIDSIEGFIDGVKTKALEPEPTPTRSPPSPMPTPVPVENPILRTLEIESTPPVAESSTMPRRNLRNEIQNHIPAQAALQTPVPLPVRREESSDSSNASCVECEHARQFDLWLDQQRQEEEIRYRQAQDARIDALLEAGAFPGDIEEIMQKQDRKEIRRERKRIKRSLPPVLRLKEYSIDALLAVVSSPMKLAKAFEMMMISDTAYALRKTSKEMIEYSNEASKAIITSPEKMIKKCAETLHLRRHQAPRSVPEPNQRYAIPRQPSPTPSEQDRFKQYSNGAIKALKTSPKKFTKAVIKSPTRIMKKCGDLLHLRRTQSIPQVGSEVGGPNHEYISDRRRIAIEKWEHDIHRKTATRLKPPSSFIEDYEFIGRGHTFPLASPKPARPDTPIDPSVPPPPVQREPRTPMRPIHGSPGAFIGFLSVIGFPV